MILCSNNTMITMLISNSNSTIDFEYRYKIRNEFQ